MGTQFLTRMFSTYIGIDLGTANCLVYVRNQGVVINEPSVVAIKINTREVLAVGSEAKSMLGKTPFNINAIRPMKDGVIANYEVTEDMLRDFIKKAMSFVPWYKKLLRPRVLIAVPSGITEVENRAVKDSAKHAGAGEVVLVEEPLAAAVGVGLPVADPIANMIVDIGGGTTEVAVISLSDIVCSQSVRCGGDEFDQAIIQYMKTSYNLGIGEQRAELIKMNIGSAYPVKDEEYMDVNGADLFTRIPKTVRITAAEVREALQEPITTIIEAVHATLEACPPELAGDLVERGIFLSGGGAKLAGLDKLLTHETGLPVCISEEPLNAVVNGTGVMLHENNIWSS